MSEHVVYFAHGKESGPWGIKITALAQVARELGLAVGVPTTRDSPVRRGSTSCWRC